MEEAELLVGAAADDADEAVGVMGATGAVSMPGLLIFVCALIVSCY